MAKYIYKYRIELDDVKTSNQISNKAILKVLENAGGMHSDSVGQGLNHINETGTSWVLLAWKVKIIKRPTYNTEITINTWSRNSNRFYSYRDYEIYDENNELCIIATSKWTLINIKDGSLAEITPRIIEVYQDEENSVFEEKTIAKLREPESFENQIKYKTLRRDIDINNHVHNLYYLDFAYEALPEEIYRSEECNNIEIMYKKQIKLGEQISCLYTKQENQHIVTIKSEDEKNLHAIVKLYKLLERQ